MKGNMTKKPVQKQTHRTAQNTKNNKTKQTFSISTGIIRIPEAVHPNHVTIILACLMSALDFINE